MYIHMCVYIYTHISIYIYTYIHIYIYTYTPCHPVQDATQSTRGNSQVIALNSEFCHGHGFIFKFAYFCASRVIDTC